MIERPNSSRVKHEKDQQTSTHHEIHAKALPSESPGDLPSNEVLPTGGKVQGVENGKEQAADTEVSLKWVREERKRLGMERDHQVQQTLARIESKLDHIGHKVSVSTSSQSTKQMHQGNLQTSLEPASKQSGDTKSESTGSRTLRSHTSGPRELQGVRDGLEHELRQEDLRRPSLESQHQKGNRAIIGLRQERDKALSRFKAMQDGFQSLQHENRDLTKELEAYKAELCKLKPSDTLTDLDVLKQYQALNHIISDWVSTTFDRLDAIRSHSNDRMATVAVRSGNANTDALCAKVESASEFVMQGIVLHVLQACIFMDRQYLPGLHKEVQQAFKNVGAGMKILNGGDGELESAFNE